MTSLSSTNLAYAALRDARRRSSAPPVPADGSFEKEEAVTAVAERPATGVMEILDHTGDTKIIWDKGDPVSVETAKAAFDTAKKKGHLAYRVTGDKGDKGAVMRSFDPDAERIILQPQMAGG